MKVMRSTVAKDSSSSSSRNGDDSCSSVSNDDDTNNRDLEKSTASNTASTDSYQTSSFQRDDGYQLLDSKQNSKLISKSSKNIGITTDTVDGEGSFRKEHSRDSRDSREGSSKSGKTDRNSGIDNEEPSEWFMLLFIVISFGYMLPWTSMGSLISYYKEAYGATFYVKLYCAYYLPGLPVALFQYRYDVPIDMMYGSQVTYLLRGVISYLILMGVLLSFFVFTSKISLIFLFGCMGVCGWLCHGTASMLASMYPSSAIINLHTGFRSPEIVAVIAIYLLGIGKSASIKNLHIFYLLNCALISTGLISWIIVVLNKTSRHYFDENDRTSDSEESENILYEYIKKQYLFKHYYLNTKTFNDNNKDNNEDNNDGLQESLLPVESDLENSSDNDSENNKEKNKAQRKENDIESDIESNLQGSERKEGKKKERESRKSKKIKESKDNSDPNNNLNNGSNNDSNKSTAKQSAKQSIKMTLVQHINDPLNQIKTSDTPYHHRIYPLSIALFIVIFCSIFQASFFAFVTSSAEGTNIEQILYFDRLFADLLGRPLTRFMRPNFLITDNQLLAGAILRIGFMLIFFFYILIPGFPKNDVFIIAIIAIFSISSGYLTVLIYEYASVGLSEKEQTAATRSLNLSFQTACFLAVLLSLAITSTSWWENLFHSLVKN